MSRFNFRQFLLSLVVTILLSLLMNWIRVILIIVFAHKFGIEHSFIDSHQDFGWFLYALFLVPYFYVLLKIDRNYQRESTPVRIAAGNVFSCPAIFLLLLPLTIIGGLQWLL